MKTKLLFLLLTALFFSCEKEPAESYFPSPRNIQVMTSATQTVLWWDAAPGAGGYAVSYGRSAAYEFVEETGRPRIVISGLDPAPAYYFAVQAKYGQGVFSPLPEPLVMEGGIVAANPGAGNEQPQADNNKTQEPFNYAVFLSKKAAWEKEGIRHYRFSGRACPDASQPAYQVTVYPGGETEIKALGGPGIDLEKPFKPIPGKTMPEFYAFIAEEVKDLGEYNAWIRYNKEYHYPEFFTHGPVQPAPVPGQPPNITGGGWYDFEILAFEVLDGAAE
jgi:hypothetical protein